MLMYPKEQKKKKRMRHPEPVIKQEKGCCYLCMRLHGDSSYQAYLEEHHVYDGPNRRISEENGFKVKLCIPHHRTGPEDVQREYEKTHSRQQFMELIGRNYLEEE